MRDYLNQNRKNYNKAIFFDRDGTLNIDTGYPYKIDDLILFDDTISSLQKILSFSYNLIIITNQSGIALGKYGIKEMHEFNKHLVKTLNNSNIVIDGIYFCPHLSQKHLNKNQQLCMCSKPNPGLLLEAQNDFNLDLSQCYLIGDKISDIAAGINANCTKNILISSNLKESQESNYKPSKIVNSLSEAIDYCRLSS